jgi:hypothetical protein
MSDPSEHAREMADLMSNAINILALIASPQTLAGAAAAMKPSDLHTHATAYADRLATMLARGGLSGPPGFDASVAVAGCDTLRNELAAWDPAQGPPGARLVAAARATLEALGLPLATLPP